MKCAFCEWEKTAKKKKRATQDAVTIFFLWPRNFSQTLAVVKNNFGGGGNRTRVRRHSTEGFYMLIFFNILIPQLLKKKDTTEPVPIVFRSPDSGQAWFAILLVDASQAPQENARETACLQIRQREVVLLHLLWSTFLTRWAEPRHAAFVSLSPSNPVRPQHFSQD